MPIPNRSAAPPAPAKIDRGNVEPLDSDPALAAEAATQHESAADGATADGRRRRIAERAYFRAERRGFAPGHELDDWLAAEAEQGERGRPALTAPVRIEWLLLTLGTTPPEVALAAVELERADAAEVPALPRLQARPTPRRSPWSRRASTGKPRSLSTSG